jgi:hypothetical protein
MSAGALTERLKSGNSPTEDACHPDRSSKDSLRSILPTGNPKPIGRPLNAEENCMTDQVHVRADSAPSPDALEETLRFLLMRYARNPSPSTAGHIAACLDTLLAHPEFKAAPGDRCTYHRMRSYWRLVERLG